MIISHERYLDETSRWHVSLQLVSRTNPMHGLLSSLDEEARRRVSGVLAAALDAITRELAPAIAASSGPAGTSTFGCGT
jgi:hypothetical protein